MSTTIRETETPRVIPAEVEEAVRRGALLLDERHPGWADKVRTECLMLSDCAHCILGQLYGDYEDGGEVLGLWEEPDRKGTVFHGFSLQLPRGQRDPEEWAELDRAWLAEIMERRSA